MLPLTRIPSLAAAGALFVLTASSISARADDLAQNLGPVGPHEPILTVVGSKRVIAFYEPDGGHCAFHAVVWSTTDVNANSAARFRADLNPRQMVLSTPLTTHRLISNAARMRRVWRSSTPSS